MRRRTNEEKEKDEGSRGRYVLDSSIHAKTAK
jgi:hypothetical protein